LFNLAHKAYYFLLCRDPAFKHLFCSVPVVFWGLQGKYGNLTYKNKYVFALSEI
jgi:hypothetical protein